MTKECVGIESFMKGKGKEGGGSREHCSSALSVLKRTFHSKHPILVGWDFQCSLCFALNINSSFRLWLI